ncbi:MAG: heme-binding protein [Kiloniellales bacterium]|nr:heme-binding protein [Kiloniellales bacterium]
MMKRMLLAFCLTAITGSGAAKAEEGLIEFKILNPDVAVELAQAALEDCRARGFQVAVSVVDRFGNAQVLIRDRFAGPHTPSTARRKAWTAISFRTDTLELSKLSQAGQPQSGVRHVTDALMIGGGVQVEAAGSIVAGVGISGAPSGEEDDACARAGILAIEDKIAF